MTRSISFTALFVALCVLLISCEQVTDWDFVIQDEDRLVVEAILTNEMKKQAIRLTRSANALNTEIQPVSDAEVTLSFPGGQIVFDPTADDPGTYESRIIFAAQKDIPYQLDIHWQEADYSASGRLSFVAPLEEITFDRSHGPDSLTIKEVGPIYHPLSQAWYELYIDWRHIDPSTSNQARLFFYSFSSVDANQLIRPTKEIVYFPTGSILIVRKLGLDPAFANYLRALALETEWQGGFFDDASSSLPTNINNNGLGFFSICAVLSDTIVAH